MTDGINSDRFLALGNSWRVTRGLQNHTCLFGYTVGSRLSPQVELCTQPNSATAES